MSRRSRSPGWLLAAAALAGCAHRGNDRITLADGLALEAISGSGPGVALSSDRPSVTSIDRAGWQPLEFAVGINGTAHYPNYSRVRTTVRETRRQRGEFPTPESCLDLVAGTQRRQRVEAMTQPFRTLGNAVLIVPRMFFRRPWTTVHSPREPYQRHRAEIPAVQP